MEEPEIDQRATPVSDWHALLSHRAPRIERAMKAISERAPGFGRLVDSCATAVLARGPHWMATAGLQARRVTVHRLTVLMLSLAVGVVVGVPQIRALFALPHTLSEGTLVALSACVGFLMYATAWFAALPIDDVAQADSSLAGGEHDIVAHWHRRFQPLGNIIDHALEYFDERPVAAGSLVFLALACAFLFSDATPLLLHAFFVCVWLGAQQFRGMLPGPATPARRAAAKLIGRTVTLLLLTNGLVELVWGLQSLLPERCAMYSMWAVMQALFALTLTLRAFDVLGLLGMLGPSWARFALAIAALALLAIWPSGVQLGTRRQQSVGSSALETTRVYADAGPRSTWLADLVARLEELPKGQPAVLVAASGGGSRAAITAALVYEKLAATPAGAGKSLADCVLLISSVSGGSLATAYFVTHKAPSADFVQAMSADFMAPLLRGVLTLGQERGQAVSSYWQERYGWRNEFDSEPRKPGRPLAVFNATDVQTGDRVGIGLPALPRGLLEPARVPADLAPQLSLSLADAVRISANFPYGFEHVHFGARPYQLIDGGIVDNTGLDTLVFLLQGLGRLATETAKPEHTLALRARSGLGERGLIVVEIDAGARPGVPSALAEHFPSLNKPLEALERAGHRNSATLRARNLEALESAVDPPYIGLVRAGPDCDSDGDVITAWALDQKARAKIQADFWATEPMLTTALELQRQAIARLHALRRDSLGAAPKFPKSAGETLLGFYQDYQERARKYAAIQHLCVKEASDAELPKQRIEKQVQQALSHTGALDHASAVLRKQLDALDALDLELHAPIAPATAMAAAPSDRGDHSTSRPSKYLEAAPPSDADKSVTAAPDREALGWVYLGASYDGDWQTRYAKWGREGLPKHGDHIRLSGTSNLRAAMPNQDGAVAKIRGTLPAEAELEVLETRRWGDTGFVWARVAAPQAARGVGAAAR